MGLTPTQSPLRSTQRIPQNPRCWRPAYCPGCAMRYPREAEFCPFCGVCPRIPQWRSPSDAGRVSGIVRRSLADERDANLLLLHRRGFDRPTIQRVLRATGFRCSRSTFFAVLARVSNEHPEGEEASQCESPTGERSEEIQTTSVDIEAGRVKSGQLGALSAPKGETP